MGLLTDVITALKEGEAIFEFRTRTGRIRRARGTLNSKLIPKEDWSKGKLLHQPSPKTDDYSVRSRMFQPFYDLDIGEWRRFKALSLTRLLNKKQPRPLTKIKDVSDDDLDL